MGILTKANTFSKFDYFKLALLEFEILYQVFENIFQDQFDFHNYFSRKATLWTYIKMISWQNKLRTEQQFIKASRNCIKCYIRLFDCRSLKKNPKDLSLPIEFFKTNPLKKQRKKIEYSFLDKPLDGAVRWARHLFNNSLEDVETYSLIAAIYRRKQKYFLAYH